MASSILLTPSGRTAGGHGLLEAVPRIYQVTPDIPDRRRATQQDGSQTTDLADSLKESQLAARSGPSPPRRTSPTTRITTASLIAKRRSSSAVRSGARVRDVVPMHRMQRVGHDGCFCCSSEASVAAARRARSVLPEWRRCPSRARSQSRVDLGAWTREGRLGAAPERKPGRAWTLTEGHSTSRRLAPTHEWEEQSCAPPAASGPCSAVLPYSPCSRHRCPPAR